MPKPWTRKKWTVNELDAFNIRISTVDTGAFFGFSESDLPAPAIIPESIVLDHVNPPTGLQLSTNDNHFFAFLLDPILSKGTDFPAQVLTIMQYELLGYLVHHHVPLPFIMNDRWINATPTVLLRDRECYILLFIETETVSFISLALWPRFPDTYKASSRQRRASAGGLCYRSICLRQCQAHPRRASSAAFQKVHWHCHD
jgi:hypothetical protein